jgi:chemotaxis protein CheD
MVNLHTLRALRELLEGERRGGRALATVRPGEWLVARAPTNIAATVDSSVVVCFWDVDARTGGVCHFALPMSARRAILVLVDELEAIGCARPRLRAKLFGGADARPEHDVGARTVAAAAQLLDELDIPVVARDTGGGRPRKITAHTDDFSVWIWRG